jgi:hypothetical protein
MALQPESAPARLNLGVAILQLGDREAGRKELPEALHLDPRLIRAYENLQDGTCDHASFTLPACQKRDDTDAIRDASWEKRVGKCIDNRQG